MGGSSEREVERVGERAIGLRMKIGALVCGMRGRAVYSMVHNPTLFAPPLHPLTLFFGSSRPYSCSRTLFLQSVQSKRSNEDTPKYCVPARGD